MMKRDKLFEHDGVPVFADHADPDQFWYLPSTIRLARRTDQPDKAQFSFIKYVMKPGAGAEGGEAPGGAYLSFGVDMRLSDSHRSGILTRLSSQGSDPRPNARLSPALFEGGGSVQLVLLDAGPGRGHGSKPAAPDAPHVVRVLGGATPSLSGALTAIFAVQLNRGAAILAETALKRGGAILGIIYDLTYLAMAEPSRVTLHADRQEVYDKLTAELGIQAQIKKIVFTGQLKAMLERLVTNGTIKSNVSITNPADRQMVQEALTWVRDDILKDWFRPVLSLSDDKPARVADAEDEKADEDGKEDENGDKENKSDGENEPPVRRLERSLERELGSNKGTTDARQDANAGRDTKGGEAGPSQQDPATPERGKQHDTPTPEPDTPTPEPDTPTPEPDTPTPEPDTPTPEPAGKEDEDLKAAASTITPATKPGDDASAAARPVRIGLTLKIEHKEVKGTFDFDFTVAQAGRRKHLPQAFFALTDEQLADPDYFLAVPLESEFFKNLNVQVVGPTVEDLGHYDIRDATVELEHGVGGGKMTRTIRLSDKEHSWTSPKSEASDTYAYSITYHFGSRWTGKAGDDTRTGTGLLSVPRPGARAAQHGDQTGRDLHIRPQEHFNFVQVTVGFLKPLDWTKLKEVQLDLWSKDEPEIRESFAFTEEYDPSRTAVGATTPDGQPERGRFPWLVRPCAPGVANPVFHYRLNYVLRDAPAGQQHEVEESVATLSELRNLSHRFPAPTPMIFRLTVDLGRVVWAEAGASTGVHMVTLRLTLNGEQQPPLRIKSDEKDKDETVRTFPLPSVVDPGKPPSVSIQVAYDMAGPPKPPQRVTVSETLYTIDRLAGQPKDPKGWEVYLTLAGTAQEWEGAG